MSSGARLAQAARACLGTAFHHQGRVAGVGVDCIGLVVVALRSIGFEVRDRLDYGMRPDGHALVEALIAHGGVRVDAAQEGDILLFRYDGQPQHVAIALDGGRLIHSFAPAGGVVETGLGAYWKRRLVGVYRFPLS